MYGQIGSYRKIKIPVFKRRLPAFLILLRFIGSIGVCRWIQYPNSIKPVTTMPAFRLSDQRMDELTAYLETLH
jgi:cytochrome c1